MNLRGNFNPFALISDRVLLTIKFIPKKNTQVVSMFDKEMYLICPIETNFLLEVCNYTDNPILFGINNDRACVHSKKYFHVTWAKEYKIEYSALSNSWTVATNIENTMDDTSNDPKRYPMDLEEDTILMRGPHKCPWIPDRVLTVNIKTRLMDICKPIENKILLPCGHVCRHYFHSYINSDNFHKESEMCEECVQLIQRFDTSVHGNQSNFYCKPVACLQSNEIY